MNWTRCERYLSPGRILVRLLLSLAVGRNARALLVLPSFSPCWFPGTIAYSSAGAIPCGEDLCSPTIGKSRGWATVVPSRSVLWICGFSLACMDGDGDAVKESIIACALNLVGLIAYFLSHSHCFLAKVSRCLFLLPSVPRTPNAFRSLRLPLVGFWREIPLIGWSPGMLAALLPTELFSGLSETARQVFRFGKF